MNIKIFKVFSGGWPSSQLLPSVHSDLPPSVRTDRISDGWIPREGTQDNVLRTLCVWIPDTWDIFYKAAYMIAEPVRTHRTSNEWIHRTFGHYL